MNKHEVTVHITSDEFTRINRILAIESVEDMTNEELLAQGAIPHRNEGIYYAEFDDGSYITFDLCYGSHNYWDSVVWTNRDGSVDVVFDCAYELGNIEAEIESELYIVKIAID